MVKEYMERIYWRFVRTSSLRGLIGLIVCCIIVGFIFDKLTEGRIWITKRGYPYLVLFFLAIMLLIGVDRATAALSSNGLSIFEIIDGSYTYIPEKSALCDEEGNRRYSSWDEYRLEYIEEHSDFLK